MEMILTQVYDNDAESLKKHYPDLFPKTRELFLDEEEITVLIVDTSLEEIVRISEKINEEFVIQARNYLSSEYPVLEIYDNFRE